MAKGLRIDFKNLGIIRIRIENVIVAKLCCILIVNIRAVGAFANLDTNIFAKDFLRADKLCARHL